MTLARLFVLIALWLTAFCVQAAPLSPDKVPDPLKPWIGWVLHGEEQWRCPFLYHDAKRRRCAWPTQLELNLDDRVGRFSQAWQVYRESWVALPGDTERWPQGVTLNGSPAVITQHLGGPGIRLAPGKYRIRGEFLWDRLPKTLAIPPDTGVVKLNVNGRAVTFPDVNAKGQLWLRQRDTGKSAREGLADRLELQVFRRIIDEIPIQVVTRIDLEVAGAQREVLLGRALLQGFIPLRLSSRLPARLEPDGRLRLQVRPGRWHVELTARHPAPKTYLALEGSAEPWPEEEVWVFDARNHLRLVEVEGVPSIDPRQTNLPNDWQQLPAYLMHPKDTLALNVIRRGDPDPTPDRLSLNRTLWLDFEGTGYTVMDQISGSMTRGWRLETNPAIALGRVLIDGQPQFITTLPGAARRGVEVRRGAIQLTADSRYHGDIGAVPAVGWDHEFQSVRATLNLPPGWKLFSASGSDNVPNSWVQRWTLLDLFVVLIIALAGARLWNRYVGVLALVTVGLIWHQAFAPQYVWLNLLAAIALLRVLPQGRLRSWAHGYRNLSLIALVLIAIPFMINEVRIGLYPQLEQPWWSLGTERAYFSGVAAPEMEIADEPLDKLEEWEPQQYRPPESKLLKQPLKTSSLAPQNVRLGEIDPRANIQTGPGLPRWQWTSVAFSWNGPVAHDQQVKLLLLSPATNLVLNLLRVGLLAWLALLMFGINVRPTGGLPWKRAGGATVPILAAVLLCLPVQEARAEFPDPAVLKELKTRLLEPPVCLPHCAQVPRMLLEVTPRTLQLRLEIHAQENVAIPLPAHANHWLPARVMVDGAPAKGLFRDNSGQVWLQLTQGRHQVSLSGPLPPRDSVQLPLALKPHRVEFKAKGWAVDGVHEDGLADSQLQLTRTATELARPPAPSLEPGTLPPFVRVERTLHLGLDWHVETRVVRVSPTGTAVVLEVPLLPGESVTTEGVRVDDRKVLVNIAGQESEYSWQSALRKQTDLILTAPSSTAWVEVWKADVSPIWHMEASGIPVIHHQDPDGHWLPEWRPWAGERITLMASRPLGVAGNTLTIDSTHLQIKPGQRALEATLSLSLRSSRGGQHTLTLPEDAELQSVDIDGTAQPIRQEGPAVTLPITPGTHSVTLLWRAPQTMSTFFKTPRVNLAAPSVNSNINITLGYDRWVLLTGGPRLGPAVLFWSVLLVLALVAVGLGRVPLTPLKSWHWFLLAIGLSQTSVWLGLLVVGWLLALGARERLTTGADDGRFNLIQVGLGLLTVLALATLFHAVQHGLLGLPDMQVAGNNSSAYNLNWYQDRVDALLPQSWVVSVPLLSYRLLMLAWALWLAFALLGWLRWGWGRFSAEGLWRPTELWKSKSLAPEGGQGNDQA